MAIKKEMGTAAVRANPVYSYFREASYLRANLSVGRMQQLGHGGTLMFLGCGGCGGRHGMRGAIDLVAVLMKHGQTVGFA
jgi:hypothetical protein